MNKILLGVSIFANLSLIAFVVGLLPFLLSLSILIIGLLIWYIKRLSRELGKIIHDLDDFHTKLEKYEKHIDEIHGMELFYGDETLQGLIKHSRAMLNVIYDFQETYFTTEDEDFDTTTEDTTEPKKESILYRGPPESDS